MLTIFVIFVLIGAVIFILASLLFNVWRDRTVKKRLKGEMLDSTLAGQGGLTRTLHRWAINIGEALVKSRWPLWSNAVEILKKDITMAGMNTAPSTFLGIQFLAAIGLVLVGLIIVGITDLLALILLLIAGYFLPWLWLRNKVNKRQRAIFRQLPDALDILTLLVEAGLDFGAAFNKLIENETGPLIDEFNSAQQEIKLGKNRMTALSDMAKKVNNRYLTSVVNSLLQSMQTGSAIGPTLRALSDQFRTERAQLAEKMGAEAPLKMMGPLLLLIFPTIFIIIFGPIVLSFMAGKIW